MFQSLLYATGCNANGFKWFARRFKQGGQEETGDLRCRQAAGQQVSKRVQKARAKARTRNVSRCQLALRVCIPGHRSAIRFVMDTTLEPASKGQHALASMFVLCPGATRITLKRSINDFVVMQFSPMLQRNGRAIQWTMNELEHQIT